MIHQMQKEAIKSVSCYIEIYEMCSDCSWKIGVCVSKVYLHEFTFTGENYVFAKDTELGMVVETYQQLDYEQQKRLLGYMDALKMNNQKNCNFVPHDT